MGLVGCGSNLLSLSPVGLRVLGAPVIHRMGIVFLHMCPSVIKSLSALFDRSSKVCCDILLRFLIDLPLPPSTSVSLRHQFPRSVEYLSHVASNILVLDKDLQPVRMPSGHGACSGKAYL